MYKEMYPHDDLVNLSEELVFEQIHQVILEGKEAFNQSEVSVQDIAAIALNKMPPKYVTNILEKQSPSASLRDEVEDLRRYARRQVIKAIKRVNEHPHD